ncbi:MAG: hypothetical protein J6J23_07595 [Clostridia bacterium]|nr:hypothetical protein [Clostridia bacterium]
MLEKIDFSKDYGEIFAEAKKKAFYVLKNPLADEIFFKAQLGDKELLDKIYIYYEPVVEYLYLKHSPMYDNDFEKQELISVFQDALIRSINSYKRKYGKSFYQYLESCACTDEAYVLKKIRAKVGRTSGVIENGDVEGFASLGDDVVDLNRSVLAQKLVVFLNDTEKDVVLSILNGESIQDYAKRTGSYPERVISKLTYAKKKILKEYLTCKNIAKEFFTYKKPVRQIAEENNMSRVEVHYWLRLHDFLYNEGQFPKMPDNPIVYERTKIAECLLSGYNLRLYKKWCVSAGDDFRRVVDRSLKKYQEAFYLVETARYNMRAVCDVNEHTPDGLAAKLRLRKFSNQEREFYRALYKHIMLDDEKPVYTYTVERKLQEQVYENVVYINII